MEAIMQQENYDIAAITEPHPEMDGYKPFRRER